MTEPAHRKVYNQKGRLTVLTDPLTEVYKGEKGIILCKTAY